MRIVVDDQLHPPKITSRVKTVLLGPSACLTKPRPGFVLMCELGRYAVSSFSGG